MVEQTASAIRFKVPDMMQPGRWTVMIHTKTHRDIKPANIKVTPPPMLVGEWGMAEDDSVAPELMLNRFRRLFRDLQRGGYMVDVRTARKFCTLRGCSAIRPPVPNRQAQNPDALSALEF
jgi:hypothetical protein